MLDGNTERSPFTERRDISLFVHQSEYCAAIDPTNDGETGWSKTSPVLDHPIFVCQVTRNFDLYMDFVFFCLLNHQGKMLSTRKTKK